MYMAVIGRASKRKLDEKNERIQEPLKRRKISVTWTKTRQTSIGVKIIAEGWRTLGWLTNFVSHIDYVTYVSLYPPLPNQEKHRSFVVTGP